MGQLCPAPTRFKLVPSDRGRERLPTAECGIGDVALMSGGGYGGPFCGFDRDSFVSTRILGGLVIPCGIGFACGIQIYLDGITLRHVALTMPLPDLATHTPIPSVRML